MFMEIEPSGPPPIAEGAYWLLTPIAIAFATPPVTVFAAHLFDQALTPAVAITLDQCRAPLILITNAILKGATPLVQLLPEQWVQALTGTVVASNDWILFSFAGGAFVASWAAAGMQRALGPITGAIIALLLALVLGISLLGFIVLAVTYWLFGDGALLAILGDRSDAAIWLPLVCPPILAALFLAANVLL